MGDYLYLTVCYLNICNCKEVGSLGETDRVTNDSWSYYGKRVTSLSDNLP